jgi:hypothetical protein
MRRTTIFVLSFLLALASVELSGQKTFKVVCDRSDNKIKIVDGEDRSPNMVPLKGGFPFYQVAQKWARDNYPDDKCDGTATARPDQPATANQAAARDQQVNTYGNPADFFSPSATPAALPARAVRYRNTSVSIALLFSDLGKVYSLDPPMIPGINIGFEQLAGKDFYGGAGLHLNTLIGKTEDAAEVGAFYNIQIPLFAGYRRYNGNNHWKVELGVSANTRLQPVTNDVDLGGEVAAEHSISAMTRVKAGKDRYEVLFGVDVWLTDILTTEEGYRMTVLSLGLSYNF